MNEWEYRVHTVKQSGEDADSSRLLTNIALPATHERGSEHGWEIFTVLPADAGVRLYMKRPKRGGAT